MIETRKNEFTPDYAVPPGQILEEILEARDIKKREFAERCGLSAKTASQIIHGKAPVTPETSIQFERVLGISAATWDNLESNYRRHLARERDRKKLERQKAWLKRFPCKQLAEGGHIPSSSIGPETAEGLLRFFGVGSIDAYEKRQGKQAANFRRSPSFLGAPESVAAWLRIGELTAEQIETESYSSVEFLAALNRIRSMTREPAKSFSRQMVRLCAGAGVALVFVPELPKTHLSGATTWLSKDKALIILSLRHKSDDHFWFSFFHEARHVLKHGKKKTFLDERDMEIDDDEEDANLYAGDFLIPSAKYVHFVRRGDFSEWAVRAFAEGLGIAPGIVVGRLQHDGHIRFNQLNHLKRKLVFTEGE